MKLRLQCLSYMIALLTIMTACVQDYNDDFSANPSSPTLPAVVRCDSSNRTVIDAKLVPVGRLSQARSGMAVATIGSKILFAGAGMMEGGTNGSARVDIYDTATRSWSRAELSQARAGIAAVTAGTKVFFAGGYFYDSNQDDYIPFATVDIYDVATNSWTVAHLSEPRGNLAAATVGDKVVFAGGQTNLYNATATVDIYDLSTGAWSTTQLSKVGCYITAVTLNYKIYFAGAQHSDGTGGFGPSSHIDIYDYETNSWSTASFGRSVEYLAGVAAAGRIYWASRCFMETRDGQSGNSTKGKLFTSGIWMGVYGQNAVIRNNKMVFYRHHKDYRTTAFDIYDIATDTWSIGVVPEEIFHTSIISVGHTIYLAGGTINNVLTDQVWKLEF